MSGSGDGSNGGQIYKPAVGIYGIAKESNHLKELTMSDVYRGLVAVIVWVPTARPTEC